MAPETLSRVDGIHLVRNKLVLTPLESRQSPIGLSDIVGAHGGSVQSGLDLAWNGHFIGGTDPAGKSFIALQQRNKDLYVPDHTEKVREITEKIGIVNPVDTAVEYAGSAANEAGDDNEGLVFLIGREVVENIEEIQEFMLLTSVLTRTSI